MHANEDETMMNGKIKAAQEKRRNKKALFISFLCMAAAVCGVSAGYLYHFEMNAKDYLWQLSAGAVIILLLLVILFQSQRKAGDQLKLLEMMVTHKSHTGKRLEDDKREIGNDLKFYYEKFEKVFSYICLLYTSKIDYHRKKADENITRRLIKTTLGKWKDEYKAQTI